MGKKNVLITNRNPTELLKELCNCYSLSVYMRVCVFYVSAEMSSLDSERENKRSSYKNTSKPVRLKQIKDGFSVWQLVGMHSYPI